MILLETVGEHVMDSARGGTAARVSLFLLVIATSAIFAFSVVYRQFGAYDLSPIVDLTWRFAQGQVPGVDFINTMPPIILIWLKLFGFKNGSWGDLVTANIVATLVTALSLMLIRSPRLWNLQWTLATSLVICLPLVYTNHIWHSTASQLVAVPFFFSLYCSVRYERSSGWMLFLLGVMAGLTALAKQNLAMPLLASSCLMLLVLAVKEPWRWRQLAAIMAGICTCLYAGLHFTGQSLSSFAYSYTAVVGRGRPDSDMFLYFLYVPSNRMLALFSAVSLIAALAMVIVTPGAKDRSALLCLVTLIVSFIPVLTDWDSKMNNATLPLFVLCTLLFEGTQRAQISAGGRAAEIARGARHFAWIALLAITLAAVYGGMVRERMRFVGPFFDLNGDSTVVGGYFRGMKVGSQFTGIIAEVNKIEHDYASKRIFFGPRLECGYRVIGAPSPKGMPLWWHPGTSYALGDTPLVIRNFIDNHFDVIVFAREDRTRLPSEILDYVDSHFSKVQGFDYLDVYLVDASKP